MMGDITAQCRLKWVKGIKRATRRTPKLTVYPWIFEIELYETKGKANIHDTDGQEWSAEYSTYDDIFHDLDLLKKANVMRIKKRAGKTVAERHAAGAKSPDGFSAA